MKNAHTATPKNFDLPVSTRQMQVHQMHQKMQKSHWNSGDPKQIIRRLGLKVTQPRLVLFDAVRATQSHMTAQDVCDLVRKSHPEIGFATVYRFLRVLSDRGYLTEVRIGHNPARYERSDRKHHDHLTCTRCGLICEFENAQIESLQKKIARHFRFSLTHHVLELYGVCSKCQIAEARTEE